MTGLKNIEQDRQIIENLDTAVAGLDIVSPEEELPGETPVQQLRRSRRSVATDTLRTLTLTEADGVLEWEEGIAVPRRPGRRGRARGGPRRVLAHYKFEKLEPSQITGFLETLDKKLTPSCDTPLRQWNGQTLLEAPVPSDGPVLLFIHGTFSDCDHLLSELQATAPGRQFLARAQRHYGGQVYTFDHPTLSVSPLLNAWDLSRLFLGSKAPVDVIAHSRGGLVTRAWFEMFSDNPRLRRRAILVGSPLAGTSLAAPPRLRSVLKLLTNVSRVLGAAAGTASAAVPLLAFVAGILKVVSSLTGVAARAPLADSIVAMIPGLMMQSRVGNNPELRRLRAALNGRVPAYHAVCANFEPDDPGWAFWKYFVQPKERLADAMADLVFEAENDLVVDTRSMLSLSDTLVLSGRKSVHRFTTQNTVHHLNYFRQPETVRFLSKCLQIG